MELYKFTGNKTVSFNSSITTGVIDDNVSNVGATLQGLTRYSYDFRIKMFNIYAKINSFLESPLSFAESNDTDLAKWHKDRELIKRFSTLGLNFSLNNSNLIFSTFVTGSSHAYDFTLFKEMPLGEGQSITVSLENKGHGLLTGSDTITVNCPYELTIRGV